MVSNPPENFPRNAPCLLYEAAGAAVDWLVGAVGFEERERTAESENRQTPHDAPSLRVGSRWASHPVGKPRSSRRPDGSLAPAIPSQPA